MFSIIKEKLFSNGKEKIVKNFAFLSVLQFLNVVLPILTIPYLISTIGIENFGLVNFVNTIILFFSVFIEFGFNNSATRDISILKDDQHSIKKIFNEVLTTKIYLFIICVIVLTILVFIIPKFRLHFDLFLVNSITLIGLCLFPLWYFQGIQQMKYVTYINAFFKTIFTLCIFIFVKNESDILYIPLFTSLGFLFSGIASLILIKYKFNITFSFTTISKVQEQLKKGYHLFLSDLYMILLSYTNVIILGFVGNDYYVGIYTTAEKVIRAFSNLLSPLINAIFPYISNKIKENLNEGIVFLKKIEKYGAIIIVTLITPVFIFANDLFLFILKGDKIHLVHEIVLVFRILIVFPLFSFLDQVYGKLILIPTGNEKQFSNVFLICLIINIGLSLVLGTYLKDIGMAISSSITQLLILIGMYYYAKKFF